MAILSSSLSAFQNILFNRSQPVRIRLLENSLYVVTICHRDGNNGTTESSSGYPNDDHSPTDNSPVYRIHMATVGKQRWRHEFVDTPPPENDKPTSDEIDEFNGDPGNPGGGGNGKESNLETQWGDEGPYGNGGIFTNVFLNLMLRLLKILSSNFSVVLKLVLLCTWSWKLSARKYSFQPGPNFEERHPALLGLLYGLTGILPFLKQYRRQWESHGSFSSDRKWTTEDSNYGGSRNRRRGRRWRSREEELRREAMNEELWKVFEAFLQSTMESRQREEQQWFYGPYYTSRQSWKAGDTHEEQFPLRGSGRRSITRGMSYESYSQKWAVLLEDSTGIVRYNDIPWPPEDNPIFLQVGDSSLVVKQKMKRALLTWHPDKFSAMVGLRLHSGDRDRIEAEARKVAHSILKFKEALEL